jgi:hypothetical protein
MSKKKNHKKTLSELITEIYDSVDPDAPTQYTSLNQVQNLVTRVKEVIDKLAKDFADAKDLILELARALVETKQCAQRSQICRKIKEILRDKITEGKVTEKWIEEYLPQEYKRRYNSNNTIKSERSSLSCSHEDDAKNESKTAEKILIDTSGHSSSTVKEENNTHSILDNQSASSLKADGPQVAKDFEDDSDAVIRDPFVMLCADKIQQNCEHKIHRIPSTKYCIIQSIISVLI